MAKLYTGGYTYPNGISVAAGKPLDDRLVLNSVEDLYINNSTRAAGTAVLYKIAYTGMPVIIANNGNPYVVLLKNSAPYESSSSTEVNASNYTTYWTISGKRIEDYISGTIDPSINKLENRLGKADTSIGTLNSSVNNLETHIKKTDSSVSTINSSVNKLETRLGKADTSVGILNSSVSALETHISKTDTSINTINSSVNKLETRLGKTDTSIGTLNSSVSALETHVSKTDVSINTINSSVNKLETRLGKTDTSIGTLNSSVSSLETHISKTDVSINTINSSVNTIHTHLEIVDTSISTLNSSVNSLETHVSNTDVSVSYLDASISNLYVNFELFGDEVTNSINAINSSYNNLVNEIIANEEVVAAAITDLNERINGIGNNGDLEVIDGYSNYDADLAFADSSGNVLAKFSNGGIVTRDFNSYSVNRSLSNLDSSVSYIYENGLGGGSVDEEVLNDILDRIDVLEENSSTYVSALDNFSVNHNADLDVADSSGNVIMRLQNGQIQTKEFDSAYASKVLNVRDIFNSEANGTVNTISYSDLYNSKMITVLEDGTYVDVNMGSVRNIDPVDNKIHNVLYYDYFDSANNSIPFGRVWVHIKVDTSDSSVINIVEKSL